MIARYPPRSIYSRRNCLKIIISNKLNSRLVAITFAIALVAASVKGEEAGGPVSGKRQPKLFYISSSTTTSTVSTSTVCFKSGTALATCSKKKRKRDIMTDLLDDPSVSIKPSRNSRMEEEEEVADILDQVEKSTENHRDPKFLLYWATLTSTSTSTSYTATQTIYSLECTPTGFGTSLC